MSASGQSRDMSSGEEEKSSGRRDEEVIVVWKLRRCGKEEG
jgi:hypothetical protein